MPRKSRENSRTGIYHVMLRGINRQNIFYDIDDFITGDGSFVTSPEPSASVMQ